MAHLPEGSDGSRHIAPPRGVSGSVAGYMWLRLAGAPQRNDTADSSAAWQPSGWKRCRTQRTIRFSEPDTRPPLSTSSLSGYLRSRGRA